MLPACCIVYMYVLALMTHLGKQVPRLAAVATSSSASTGAAGDACQLLPPPPVRHPSQAIAVEHVATSHSLTVHQACWLLRESSDSCSASVKPRRCKWWPFAAARCSTRGIHGATHSLHQCSSCINTLTTHGRLNAFLVLAQSGINCRF